MQAFLVLKLKMYHVLGLRTRDLIYLRCVVIDFLSCAGADLNSGDSASPSYLSVSDLPDYLKVTFI